MMSHRDARRQLASAAAHRRARLPPGPAYGLGIESRDGHERSAVSPHEEINE